MPSFIVDKTLEESSNTAEWPALGCLYWNKLMDIKCNVNATYGHFYIRSAENYQPGRDSNQFSKMLVISKTGSAHLHVQVLNHQCHHPNVQGTMQYSLLAVLSGIFWRKRKDFRAYLRILVGIIQLVFLLDLLLFKLCFRLPSFCFILLFVHPFVSMC